MTIESNKLKKTDSQARPSKAALGLEGRASESAAHELPKRKSLPHHPTVSRPNQSTLIFLTVCTKDRRNLLAQNDVHDIILNSWQNADAWCVGRYVLMPNHLHLFCAPATNPVTSLRQWVFRWRAAVTRNWPRPSQKPIWQKDFFDRQLRRGQGYSEKWAYVRDNPIRAGLVEAPEDWPFQGELNRLTWHDSIE